MENFITLNKLTVALSIRLMILSGKNNIEIADDFFGTWCRYRKSFAEYRMLISAKVCRDVSVYVLWGKPGTGKTRIVFDTFPSLWIASDPTLQWFNGYNGEDVVLLDDYRGEASDSFLLRLLDRYPMLVPTKGGFVPWVPTTIIIASNLSPPFQHFDIGAAISRRLKHVIKMDINIYDHDLAGIQYIRRILLGEHPTDADLTTIE